MFTDNMKKNERNGGRNLRRRSRYMQFSENILSSISILQRTKIPSKAKKYELNSSNLSTFEEFSSDNEQTIRPQPQDLGKILVDKVIEVEVLNQLHQVQSTQFETD